MEPKLKRELSLWQITLIGVGIIVGAGIYVLIGEAAGMAGNAVWLSFILAAIVAAFTGLSYAELSSVFPKAGAEYVYIDKTLGKKLAWIVGWLIIISSIISSSAVSIGFANYFSSLFSTPIILTALTVILLCGVILIAGIKESAFLTILCTCIELIGLAIIIFIGLPHIGSVNYLEMASGLSGIFRASSLVFFAYIGFESITRLAEETKNPSKIIPKAVLLSIAITTIIYVLVAISAVSVLGWNGLSSSSAPLAFVASHLFGDRAFLVLSVIALFSTFNTVLVVMLGASRLIYGIAEFRILPRVFLSISRKTHTPWVAIVTTTLLGMFFVLFFGNIKIVANLTNFAIFMTFIFVNAAVIWMRYKKPDKKRGFTTPLSIGKMPVLPVLGIITCLFMLANIEIEVLAYGAALVIIGFLIYELGEVAVDHKKVL